MTPASTVRFVGACLALTSLVACGAQASVTAPTTLIVVRHAEREPGDDPPLNAEGLKRAESLAKALEQAGLTAIYTTQYIRNRQTAEPLAARRGVAVTVRPIDFDETVAYVANLLEDIRRNHPGGVVLVIGHANGMNAQIFAQLGGVGAGPNRYEDLYVVTLPYDSAPRLVLGTYGGRSSLDP